MKGSSPSRSRSTVHGAITMTSGIMIQSAVWIAFRLGRTGTGAVISAIVGPSRERKEDRERGRNAHQQPAAGRRDLLAEHPGVVHADLIAAFDVADLLVD